MALINNILQYLENTVADVPDKLAFSDGEGGLTFAALSDAARAVGSALLADGYTREPVLILMDKHPEEIAAFLGCVCAGCFYAALDADMPDARIALIMDTLKPRVMICDARNRRRADALRASGAFGGSVLDYSALAAAPTDPAALAAVRDRQIDTDPIYVVFTSGSTGVPKGVAACHRSVIDYTEALCEAIGFSRASVFANQSPLYFDAPLKEIMPVLKYGATAYLVPKMLFSFPIRLVDYLNKFRVNTICWVATALTMVSSLGVLDKNPPLYLHTVCFGSEVFPRRQYDLWRAALPDARFFNLYGPTEATGMSCFWPAVRPLDPDEPIPVGRPFRNTEILLLNDDGTRTPDGETGEICMRGTCVTLGYYNNPQKTSEAFVQNPLNTAYPELIYRTGDLGRYNAHGELVFVSRRDAQIKISGHRVELGEIEAAALSDPRIRTACCVFDAGHTRLVLFYVGDADPKAMSAVLRDRLPRYMLPAVCVPLSAMPLMPNAKIDRKGLRTRAEQDDLN